MLRMCGDLSLRSLVTTPDALYLIQNASSLPEERPYCHNWCYKTNQNSKSAGKKQRLDVMGRKTVTRKVLFCLQFPHRGSTTFNMI